MDRTENDDRDSCQTSNRLIVESRTDIINYPYIEVLHLWELEKRGGTKRRRTRIFNVYDICLNLNWVWAQEGRR